MLHVAERLDRRHEFDAAGLRLLADRADRLRRIRVFVGHHLRRRSAEASLKVELYAREAVVRREVDVVLHEVEGLHLPRKVEVDDALREHLPCRRHVAFAGKHDVAVRLDDLQVERLDRRNRVEATHVHVVHGDRKAHVLAAARRLHAQPLPRHGHEVAQRRPAGRLPVERHLVWRVLAADEPLAVAAHGQMRPVPRGGAVRLRPYRRVGIGRLGARLLHDVRVAVVRGLVDRAARDRYLHAVAVPGADAVRRLAIRVVFRHDVHKQIVVAPRKRRLRGKILRTRVKARLALHRHRHLDVFPVGPRGKRVGAAGLDPAGHEEVDLLFAFRDLLAVHENLHVHGMFVEGPAEESSDRGDVGHLLAWFERERALRFAGPRTGHARDNFTPERAFRPVAYFGAQGERTVLESGQNLHDLRRREVRRPHSLALAPLELRLRRAPPYRRVGVEDVLRGSADLDGQLALRGLHLRHIAHDVGDFYLVASDGQRHRLIGIRPVP